MRRDYDIWNADDHVGFVLDTYHDLRNAYYFATNGQDGELAIFPTDMQAKFFGNYVIEPQVGKLVLFRSEVFHRVSPNLTESDRISFSFNYLLTNSPAT